MAGIIWGISRALHEGTKFDRATYRCVSRNQVTRGLTGRSGPFQTGAERSRGALQDNIGWLPVAFLHRASRNLSHHTFLTIFCQDGLNNR